MLTFNLSPQPGKQSLTPFIDIYDLEDSVIVLADMPGVSKENTDLSVVTNQVTIHGQCSRELADSQSSTTDAISLVRECPHCDYYRVLELSDTINANEIEAQMKDGVLTLILPKKRATQSIEIPISIK